MDERLEANRANWDERVPIHRASAFYDVERWLRERPGPRAWEADVLGDVTGLDLVHLQCHFGLDTLRWLPAGAATVTGLDFSPAAVAEATALAAAIGAGDRARFVEADVLDAAAALAPDRFDVVYVSLGALCWLPSVERWAAQVAALLRPGGRLFLHDGHPVQWSLDDVEPTYRYTGFEEQEQPFVDDFDSTYGDRDARLVNTRQYEWNHSIGEIVTALLAEGLVLRHLTEHDWTVYPRFDWLVPTDDGRYVRPADADRPRIPLSFTLLAESPEAPPGA